MQERMNEGMNERTESIYIAYNNQISIDDVEKL